MDSRVLVEDKAGAGFLVWFFVVVLVAVAASVLIGSMGLAAKAIIAVVCLGCAVVLVIGWLRAQRQPPGRIEITGTSIVQWHRTGRFTRIERQTVTVGQGGTGAHRTGWFLSAESGTVERGAPGAEPASVEGSIMLLGYDPREVVAACTEAGWVVADR